MRTTVFFKGCNLNCFWCHNPEGKAAAAEAALFSEKCIGCGVCRRVCAHTEGCIACGACAETCPAGARKVYGRTYTVQELFSIIAADRAYYDATGGGVTFSGGECMLYPDFLAEVAKRCVENGISVAIDTAGNVPYESFERVLPYVDVFLYDIKALDPALHRCGTGVDNRLILQNLERLCQSKKRILVRVPVIPDFNEGAEAERIGAYCAARSLPFEYLTYHTLGEGKERALRNAAPPKA